MPDEVALAQWLMDIRTETFYDPNFSMDNFEPISVLGRGVFGKVMLAKHKTTNELSAIKSIHKNSMISTGRAHTIMSERATLATVKSPFIVQLKFAFQSSTKFYIGLEYVPGGELLGLLGRVGRIEMSDVKIYVAEIGLALVELHSKGIVYRDLKPENVLIAADGHLKLTDFGLSKRIGSHTTGSFCGSIDYMAPEIVQGAQYSYEVDSWALGVLTYHLIFGKAPFSDRNREQMMNKIIKVRPDFEAGTDGVVIDFIQKLLVKDPKKRTTFENLRTHPFFGDMTMNDVLEKKYTPSFVPEINDVVSTEYFDEQFTAEPAIDSLGSATLDNEVFSGFAYTAGAGQIDT
jgi:serine/threonine protein kinase